MTTEKDIVEAVRQYAVLRQALPSEYINMRLEDAGFALAQLVRQFDAQPKLFGCFVDAVVGEEVAPDCVLDHNRPDQCIYAKCGDKHLCKYWAPDTDANKERAAIGLDPIK